MRILKSLKTLIRCRDLERSRSFYTTVLGLEVVEEWQQSQAKGCILAFGDGGKGGFLELAEVAPDNDRHDRAYALPVANDKMELQINQLALIWSNLRCCSNCRKSVSMFATDNRSCAVATPFTATA